MTTIDSVSKKLDKIEAQHPPKSGRTLAEEEIIHRILDKMSDEELDVLDCAATYRSDGQNEEEVTKYLTSLGKFKEYEKAVEHFRKINRDMIEAQQHDND
jgi:hypothetical protein